PASSGGGGAPGTGGAGGESGGTGGTMGGTGGSGGGLPFIRDAGVDGRGISFADAEAPVTTGGDDAGDEPPLSTTTHGSCRCQLGGPEQTSAALPLLLALVAGWRWRRRR